MLSCMLILAVVGAWPYKAWLLTERNLQVWEMRNSLRRKGLHGAKGRISEGAAQPFSCVARLIAMLLVEEGVERSMEGLDLRL